MSDTLAQLQKALTSNKSGMQRIPFALDSYQHPSKPLSSKHLVNLMGEKQPADSRTTGALLSTAGLVLADTIGTGPVRAMSDEEPGRVYMHSGDHLWRIGRDYIDGGPEDLGFVGVGTGDQPRDVMTTIACGPTAMVICVPPRAYTCTHTGPLNQITGDFPGATSVAYCDGYFVFTSTEIGSKWFISGLLDPLAYNALDFVYSDGLTNVVRRAINHRGEVWLFGDAGVEIWYDAGYNANLDFPFRRQSGGIIWIGVASIRTIAEGDNSVFWLGTDSVVYRSDGYRAVRISTHAIEDFTRRAGILGSTTADLSFCYSQGGHTLYCLNFPDRTFVYDVATSAWHERTGPDGTGRWRPTATATVGTDVSFGDGTSGKIFFPDPSIGTEDGVPITRLATMPPLWVGTRRAFCNRVELELEAGTGTGDVRLQWSDDGGNTWNAGRVMSTGTPGAFRTRAYCTRLGSFRQRMFQFSCTGHATFYAMDADITDTVGGSS